MKPLLIANWKANPATLKEAVSLAAEVERKIVRIRKVEIVLAPSFPFLSAVSKVLKKSKLGAQDVFWAKVGPYTGEVSQDQLKGLGVRYVILGHSERKLYLGETDEMINKKLLASFESGLRPVLCIGERKRENNDIPAVVGEQLKNALKGVKRENIGSLTVAYEPVWAISTTPGSKPDTPDNAWKASVYIKKIVAKLYGKIAAESVRIIYGGSVNSKNIASFLAEGRMEGALVGNASLDPEEFSKIVAIAANVKSL